MLGCAVAGAGRALGLTALLLPAPEPSIRCQFRTSSTWSGGLARPGVPKSSCAMGRRSATIRVEGWTDHGRCHLASRQTITPSQGVTAAQLGLGVRRLWLAPPSSWCRDAQGRLGLHTDAYPGRCPRRGCPLDDHRRMDPAQVPATEASPRPTQGHRIPRPWTVIEYAKSTLRSDCQAKSHKHQGWSKKDN